MKCPIVLMNETIDVFQYEHNEYWLSIFIDPRNEWFQQQFTGYVQPYINYAFKLEQMDQELEDEFETLIIEQLNCFYTGKLIPNLVLNEIQCSYFCEHFKFVKQDSVLFDYLCKMKLLCYCDIGCECYN